MPIKPEIFTNPDCRIHFEKPGEATVLNGPFSGKAWKETKITMDGRHYKCAGKVILKNGTELFANLPIRTHTFDFLEREGVYCLIEDTWYRPDEPEFLEKLGITSDEAFPYTWMPDRPLNYHIPGPYPMDWYASIKSKTEQDRKTV
jgi:hypothetical protein